MLRFLINESTPTPASPRLRRGVFRGVFRGVSRPGAVTALAATALAALALAAPRGAFGQCQYEVTAIIQYAPPNCPILITVARGMNEHGHVVGYFNHCLADLTFAFLWTPEDGLTALPTPEGVTFARAEDINDAGVIIGRHTFTGVGFKAFAWDPETEEYTYLEPLHDGAVATDLTVANAINNDGLVAGSRVISKPGETVVRNAVIWDTNTGEVTDLGVLDGPSSAAEDGNGATDAAGWSGSAWSTSNAKAVIWTEKGAIELGVLPGAIQSAAFGMNNSHHVVGISRIPEGPWPPVTHGFYWSSGDMIQLLPPEPFGRFPATDINDHGQVMGTLATPSNTVQHAGLWQDGVFHDLNDLAIDGPDDLHMGSGIKALNNGLILASGKLAGKTVGVVLTPIEVPVGDLNFDCAVDHHDLLILVDQWGKADSSADLSDDGIVNVDDLLILLANWGP